VSENFWHDLEGSFLLSDIAQHWIELHKGIFHRSIRGMTGITRSS
jgi:hypothetical protein